MLHFRFTLNLDTNPDKMTANLPASRGRNDLWYFSPRRLVPSGGLLGAAGYVVKPQMALDLVLALHAALQGERFISPCPELEGVE